MKIKKKIIGLTLSAVASLGILTGCVSKNDIKVEPLINKENVKIDQIADFLDCDKSYMTYYSGNYFKLNSNEGEPIYINIDNVADELKESCTDGFNYVFNVLHKINANYSHEFVDENTFEDAEGKTKIKVASTDEYKWGDSDARISAQRNNYGSIVINENRVKDYSSEKVKNIIKHEIMHLLGFDDVYVSETKALKGNTLLNPKLGDEYGMFTPNDIKCLYAMYYNVDNAITYDELNQIKAKVDNYSVKYYQKFADIYVKNAKAQGSTIKEIENPNLVLSGKNTMSEPLADGTERKWYNKFTIETSNNKYTLTLINEDGSYYEQTMGDFVFINGVIILKDVKLKKGPSVGIECFEYENGFVTDLVIQAINNEKVKITGVKGLNGGTFSIDRELELDTDLVL